VFDPEELRDKAGKCPSPEECWEGVRLYQRNEIYIIFYHEKKPPTAEFTRVRGP